MRESFSRYFGRGFEGLSSIQSIFLQHTKVVLGELCLKIGVPKFFDDVERFSIEFLPSRLSSEAGLQRSFLVDVFLFQNDTTVIDISIFVSIDGIMALLDMII